VPRWELAWLVARGGRTGCRRGRPSSSCEEEETLGRGSASFRPPVEKVKYNETTHCWNPLNELY
jgi:hypothetical protein